jgi:hypothetical protein
MVRVIVRCLGVVFAVMAVVSAVSSPAAADPPKKPHRQPVMVERSASGTIIQPTTTIINGPSGQRTVIVIPRQRSYLDTGTEVSVGDRGYMDYMLPPGGDPGRPNWFIGPDVQGRGSYPLPGPFSIPGFNPDTPF